MNLRQHALSAAALLATAFMLWITVADGFCDQGATGNLDSRGRARYSLSISPRTEFRTGLDQGGHVAISGILFASSVTMPTGDQADLSFSLRYIYEDYEFTTPVFSMGRTPWSEIHQIAGAASYSRILDNGWRLSLSPSVRYSGESGAKLSDSHAWGGVFSLSNRVRPDLLLGAGFAYFDDIEKKTIMPIILIRWEINDHLILGNARQTGPAGPAGLELSFRGTREWVVATGAAWRSKRFRFDQKNRFAPGGVGMTRSVPVWLRLSYDSENDIKIDFYGGILTSGDLRVDDGRGNRLVADDHNRALFASITISASF